MPYDSDTGLYERRTTTVIDASPDGDTVYIAIDAKLDLAADDTVVDLNHHAENGNHYPATSTASDSRFFRQSPSGAVSWAVGIPAADAALKDMSNVASGAIAPAKIAQDASNRFVTDAERTKLSGIEAGAQVHIAPTKAEVEAVLTGTISTHSHTIADASTTAKGLIEIATDAEVQAGTSTSLAVTPAGMKAGLNASGDAPTYACRAWVNFDGTLTGPISPRGSGNVSSVTKNGTGDYTVNFTTAMQDANYSGNISINYGATVGGIPYSNTQGNAALSAQTSSAFRFSIINASGSSAQDKSIIVVNIVR